MNRYILVCVCMLFSAQCLTAQIASTTLVVNSHPTAVLSDWANDNSVITYVVSTQGGLKTPVKIKTTLMLADGTVISTNDLSKALSINLTGGTHVFYARDVIPLEIMAFSGSYRSSLTKTGKLPTGYYQLSVQLVLAGTYDPVSEVVSKFFNLTGLQLPVLIKPYANDTLGQKESQTAIIFRWTPIVGYSGALPHYRLQVFEVLENQQAMQALRGNQSILDITLTGQTQYIWRPQLSFIDEPIAREFIWTIQGLDADNNPLVLTDGNGESRSEPIEFFVRTH